MLQKRRRGVSDVKSVLAMVVAGVVIIGMGMGFSSELSSSQNAVQGAIQSVDAQYQTLEQHQQQSAPTASQDANTPYQLTLVITQNDQWNSSTTDARYWVVTPDGWKSAQNINLPAHRLIQLTIEDFDTPTPLPAQYAQVNGTVGNSVLMMNVTAISQSPTNDTNYGMVSSLDNNSQVAHTFTIPQLGINIPSAPYSIEVAEFTINQTGTFVWHCEDPCGDGDSGWLGIMNSNGWMGGTITVS